jgi:hypothetical protein
MTTDASVYEPDTGLVAALWRFVENSGSTEEFSRCGAASANTKPCTTPQRTCWKHCNGRIGEF